jgi:hypothetical protein
VIPTVWLLVIPLFGRLVEVEREVDIATEDCREDFCATIDQLVSTNDGRGDSCQSRLQYYQEQSLRRQDLRSGLFPWFESWALIYLKLGALDWALLYRFQPLLWVGVRPTWIV